MTSNGGTNWVYASEGIPFVPCIDFDFVTIDSVGGLRVATHGQSAFQTDFPVTVEVQKSTSELPTSFSLSQNYPNPFNPSTAIHFQIPELSFVTLKVYDVLGNEIEKFVNEEKPAGTYEVTWYAENLPSGVYFYQLRAGEYIAVKKMLLLR
jgi:hypothetical protein